MYLSVEEFIEKLKKPGLVVWGLRKDEATPSFLFEVENSLTYTNACLNDKRSCVEKELSQMADRQEVVVIEIHPLPWRVSERPNKTAIIDDFGYDGNSLHDISMIAVQDPEDANLIDVLYENFK